MDVNFPELEEKILKFWRENLIFKKSISRRKKSRNFVFYEGPPTANGKPGIHHVLTRVFKDIICRYKTMRGFRVERKAGWDTHGLPVELEVEKKLGLKNKKDIEKYGIAKFNKNCQESVWQYKKEWEKLTDRIGFWLDEDNPYVTYQTEYIETVWHILKRIYQKGLLYHDYKVVPYCPRCGTTLSSHEVAQGYEKIKDPSIFVKFRIKNPEFKDSYLLIWTTTPWTLPGNVAIAVNPEMAYAKIKSPDIEEYLILAKDKIAERQIKGKIVQEFKGKDLAGLAYEPAYADEDFSKSAYRVILADFVSLESGTGLVHIAPGFGLEDMEAVKNQNTESKRQGLPELPILLPVNEEGKFALDAKKWAGMFVKEADPLIINDLKERGFLFAEELYEHDYPFCWRCHSPLLYYARKSWFIQTTKIKDDLIGNNQKINWVPVHLKEGRFGEWLRDLKDWALTRERYWGTPLPIWQCKTCGKQEIIGSRKELFGRASSGSRYFIFRHGYSLRQIKKVSSCWPEKVPFPLTKKGEREVEVAAKKLKNKKIDLIFSSDLLRAKQTARIIAKETGAKIIIAKQLRDYNVGVFNYKNPKLSWEYLEKSENPILTKLPKGESLANIRKRMYEFLKRVNEKYPAKNIVIVSHELPLTILEQTLSGLELEEILKQRAQRKINPIATAEWREIKFKTLPFNGNYEIDLHRPYIDEMKFQCLGCQGEMERVSEVIDCWFDSGSMPFAQARWPFSGNLKPEPSGAKPPKLFPADYIAEGVDQTRGWFYTLLAISTLLGFGSPYKNVISLGHILDEKGEKMSKSKGNIVDPWYIAGRYGADAARWYFYTVNQPGEAKLFSEKDIDQALKRFILIFWNCFTFWETYKKNSKVKSQKTKPKNVLDRWIISRLNRLVLEATESLDRFDVTGAARIIENFVINDLSLWYIRRSRKRFKEIENFLALILLAVCKLGAPFFPFLSEEIYQKISGCRFSASKSVHLEKWPIADKKLIDKKLEGSMNEVREIVNLGLRERAKSGIKVRQPLGKLQITNCKLQKEEELLGLIREEVNVKEITFGESLRLDTEITEELEREGIVREVVRQIQGMRKEAKLRPKDKISVSYLAEGELGEILEKSKSLMLEEANISDLVRRREISGEFLAQKEIKVGDEKLWLGIKKI
ncbi:MAG: class I tRNA ligase family protein [bacterium]